MILRIENFLSKKDANDIENQLSSDQFPWFYQDSLVSSSKDQFFFNHNMHVDGRINSNMCFIGDKIVDKIKKIPDHNFKNLTILRSKCNLYTKQSKNLKSDKHVDIKRTHLVGIYNVNTNNGGTIIHDKKEHFIPSIKNSLVLFEGHYEHQAVFQTDTKLRLNINLNLI